MKNIYIPSGEKGSINERAKRALTNSDNVVAEIYDKPTTCLNIISVLVQYGGTEIGLEFAKKIIAYRQ